MFSLCLFCFSESHELDSVTHLFHWRRFHCLSKDTRAFFLMHFWTSVRCLIALEQIFPSYFNQEVLGNRNYILIISIDVSLGCSDLVPMCNKLTNTLCNSHLGLNWKWRKQNKQMKPLKLQDYSCPNVSLFLHEAHWVFLEYWNI